MTKPHVTILDNVTGTVYATHDGPHTLAEAAVYLKEYAQKGEAVRFYLDQDGASMHIFDTNGEIVSDVCGRIWNDPDALVPRKA